MNRESAWEAFSQRLFDQNAFAIKLGLDNIRRALGLEGHPEECAPAIVVGGTNGKGSVASALSSILIEHGLRVGLYTSPHLIELRERFRVDGRPLSRAATLRVGARVLETYGESNSDPCLTFFELTTLTAALLFADAQVDAVVWEVGLGGRLDAVNAIEPALTVITNIDEDHQQYLGETIEEIAREKAGLHRPGVPLVLAPQSRPEAHATFAQFPETQFCTAPKSDSRSENVATARLAARAYLGPRFVEHLALSGIERWRWPGRMDRREVAGTHFILDAAHNPAGTRRLYNQLIKNPPDACVIGAMADKALRDMFSPLAELGVPVFLATVDSKRAASVAQLRAVVPPELVAGSGNAPNMFDAASSFSEVAVFGSVYLLGEWFSWAEIDASDLTTHS